MLSAGWHSSLPWSTVRAAYRSMRTALFTAPRPEGEYVLVPGKTPADLEVVFGQQSFAPNWEVSYNKRGEDLNLAKVVHHDTPDHGAVWWQYHVRGWHHEGTGTLLRCHWETEPTEHADEHLAADGWRLDRGMIAARRVLEKRGIGWETVEWTADEGVAMTHSEDPR